MVNGSRTITPRSKQAFGLDAVAYPYPSGSWDNYITYVKTSSSVRGAGYKKQYGYMTLINYWLENQAAHSQTPDLWKVGAQPIQAVKDSTDVFMDYIQRGRHRRPRGSGHLQFLLADSHGRASSHREFRSDHRPRSGIARRATTIRTPTSAPASVRPCSNWTTTAESARSR